MCENKKEDMGCSRKKKHVEKINNRNELTPVVPYQGGMDMLNFNVPTWYFWDNVILGIWLRE